MHFPFIISSHINMPLIIAWDFMTHFNIKIDLKKFKVKVSPSDLPAGLLETPMVFLSVSRGEPDLGKEEEAQLAAIEVNCHSVYEDDDLDADEVTEAGFAEFLEGIQHDSRFTEREKE